MTGARAASVGFVPEPITPESLVRNGVTIDVEHKANVAITTARIPAGRFLGQHMHSHDHQSVLVSGTVRLWIDGQPKLLSGFQLVLIERGRSHSVEAVEDAVWLCVWPVKNEEI